MTILLEFELLLSWFLLSFSPLWVHSNWRAKVPAAAVEI